MIVFYSSFFFTPNEHFLILKRISAVEANRYEAGARYYLSSLNLDVAINAIQIPATS